MNQPRNEPAPEERVDVLRVRPQGAMCIGDVDGDGLADVVYVDDTQVTLWINQSGNAWSDPIEIQGTPPVSDIDAVRLADIFGRGISGVLWSADFRGLSRESMFFLDFTGGIKPYLLSEMDNHMGAVTRVEYASSTRFSIADQKRPETRWKTPLPFPVQVVSRVEVIDQISGGKLTTEYSYHHGYWDGAEREFRGFGRVDQRDTEAFERYHAAGLHPERRFENVGPRIFSPPSEARTWFHQGPVGDEFGDWEESDFSSEFSPRDPPLLRRPAAVTAFLNALPRRAKRDALRTLRGSVLRTEVYALDGTELEDRPYSVIEYVYEAREESIPGPDQAQRLRIFFPHALAQRTTHWERGDDPMTQYMITDDYDAFGQSRHQTAVALPRRAARRGAADEIRILATHSRTVYADPDPGLYLHDRIAYVRTFELRNPPRVNEVEPDNLSRVMSDQASASQAIHQRFRTVLDVWGPGQPLPPELRLLSHTINHYDGAPLQAFIGRPAGEVGPYGALTRSESLAFTGTELDTAYAAERPAYLGGVTALPPGAPAGFGGNLGYRREQDGITGYHDGYYFDTERQRFDFHDPPSTQGRGAVIGLQDALGHESAIRPDSYWMLAADVTDPVGLVTIADYDYRVMQPREVTDPNGNRTRFTFTPLGLLATTAVIGKVENNEGDQARASVQRIYDYLAFENSPPDARQPISVRSRRYIHHDTELGVPLPERDQTIEVVEYSDGFGRLLQTRTQAEDVLFDAPGSDPVFGSAGLPEDQSVVVGDAVGRARSAGDESNVVVSGWQIYDNKGRVVEQYEPFFSRGWDYSQPRGNQFSLGTVTFYDPRGQILRTVKPDGSENRVIFGVPFDLDNPDRFTPTPWHTFTYDHNDNAGRTHAASAGASQHHWNTPASSLLDALGRTLEAVSRNRRRPDPAQPWQPIEEYRTHSTYDLQGNLLTVTDTLGRVVFRRQYDLVKRPLRVDSIDGGTRFGVFNALGNMVEQRDSKGAVSLHDYDALNRPAQVWARDNAGEPLTLREHMTYGDAGDPNQSSAERDASRVANRLGKPHYEYDEAGLVTYESYDFKGNTLEKTRRVISDGQLLSVFANGAANNWQVIPFRVNWQPPIGISLQNHANSLLGPAEYRTSFTYDALNRVTSLRNPQDQDGERKLMRPHYNRAGALERVLLDDEVYVDRIVYNAKGQRLLIAYGNNIMSRYAYDAGTFRLVRVRTERYATPAALTYQPAGSLLQDCVYVYDLIGNILTTRERTPGCGVINTANGPNGLGRSFTYDPLYRLVSATGRECTNIAAPRSWADEPQCGFNSSSHGTPDQDNAPNLTRRYTEEYAYDPAGNMVSLRHVANGNAWTRHFGMGGLSPQQWDQEWQAHLNVPGGWPNPPANQLTHVGDDQPVVPQTHMFDPSGNLTRETTSRHFEWDHSNRMRVYRTQTSGSEPSVHAQYLYDRNGQRVKKFVRRTANNYDATVYLDSVFEHQHRVRPGETSENNTLHIVDDRNRIALVRVGNAFADDGAPSIRVRYQLGDHVGSCTVVVGGVDAVTSGFINREEFFPYGESSFGSFARKRYRFTGKEREEESGLYYHGARYSAPWLARWTSCDPLELSQPVRQSGEASEALAANSTLHPYMYAAANPLRYSDPTGLQEVGEEELRLVHGSEAAKEVFSTLAPYAEAAAGLNPLISTVEAATGESSITRQPLASWERVLSLPGIGSVAKWLGVGVAAAGTVISSKRLGNAAEVAEALDPKQIEIFKEFAEAGRRGGGSYSHQESEVVSAADRIVGRLELPRFSELFGRALARWHAGRLADALEAAGQYRLPGHQPHHIVAWNDHRAAKARAILKRADIDIDSAVNGIWLPNTVQDEGVEAITRHRFIHTDDYYEEITNWLRHVEQEYGSEGVRDGLLTIKGLIADRAFRF